LKQKGREKRECRVVFEQLMTRFTQDCHILKKKRETKIRLDVSGGDFG
jgi:hypothetical protein